MYKRFLYDVCFPNKELSPLIALLVYSLTQDDEVTGLHVGFISHMDVVVGFH